MDSQPQTVIPSGLKVGIGRCGIGGRWSALPIVGRFRPVPPVGKAGDFREWSGEGMA